MVTCFHRVHAHSSSSEPNIKIHYEFYSYRLIDLLLRCMCSRRLSCMRRNEMDIDQIFSRISESLILSSQFCFKGCSVSHKSTTQSLFHCFFVCLLCPLTLASRVSKGRYRGIQVVSWFVFTRWKSLDQSNCWIPTAGSVTSTGSTGPVHGFSANNQHAFYNQRNNCKLLEF